MLNRLIQWALRNRALVLIACVLVLLAGARIGSELPVEVLPDLTKPTVTILLEAPGLAPEEVEAQVTVPIENALMGIAGLSRMRTSSDIALGVVFAEFDWGTDIYKARQFVQERLQGARASLPADVQPYLTPVTSLMGEILLIGLRGTDGSVAPMELRTLADWTVRRRLQAIPGIAEILNIGGGVKQAQIQPDPWRMQANQVSLEELTTAAREAASNTTGGFLTSGSQEIMVRNLAMTTRLEDIAGTLVKTVNDRPISISDVASVVWGPEPMRGTASIDDQPGVIMAITKAPGFDTIGLTEQIEAALAELKSALPQGVEAMILFQQRDFIDRAIGNLSHAIRDGALMVLIVLVVFLLNLRTTFITLMAMPLSFAVTLITFKLAGLSVNSMTLGGLAVAIGMVVDDAIVDVENVFRRLKVNATLPEPLPKLVVISAASGEVRNSIFYATVLIILVLLPLLGLTGIEGRLFGPIAIATIISMVASFVVSLTAIPVLCSLLLRDPARKAHAAGALASVFRLNSPGRFRKPAPAATDKQPSAASAHTDTLPARVLKWLLRHSLLRVSLDRPAVVLLGVAVLLVAALSLYPKMGRDFLPAFHEETVILTTGAAPGTSMTQMEQLGTAIERQLRQVPEINHIGRRIGRAERSDHVIPMSNIEFDIDFKTGVSSRSTAEVIDEIRQRAGTVPGSFSTVSGPLSHRINHMLSGSTAPVAVKVFGPDLRMLTGIGAQIQKIAKTIPGLGDARLDNQAAIPQLRIEVDRERAAAYGIRAGALNDALATLLGGEAVAILRDEQRTIDLAIRLPDDWREDPARIAQLPVEAANGRSIPLSLVADVREATGPNSVFRENTQRRFIVSIKPTQRDVGRMVDELKKKVTAQVKLPEGYFLAYEGEFAAEQAAAQRIWILFGLVLAVIGLLLRSFFRSTTLALLVLVNLPLALIGSLFLTWKLIDNISIATLVGFIAVGGVAARNGIMMISHYLHLMNKEGEGFTRQMIERGTLERLLPVTMTALAAGIALIPLLFAAGEPGKEILHPVAVCIVGGLVTSTLLNFVVTPALFRLFGRKAALRAVESNAPACL
jgi:Cu/Ag efflux pump CusA